MLEIGSDLHAYKLNEKKALDWLEKKVERLMSNAAFKEGLNEEDSALHKLEAVYTLANYLNKEWFKKLLERLE